MLHTFPRIQSVFTSTPFGPIPVNRILTVTAAVRVTTALAVGVAIILTSLPVWGQSVVFQGLITTVAGPGTPGTSGDNGPATLAYLQHPFGVAVDSTGNFYIADRDNGLIRKVTRGGVITTVAGGGSVCAWETDTLGDGCPATQAQLNFPTAVAVDGAGNLYIADSSNNRIRMVNANTGIIATVAGGGAICVSHINPVGDGCPATQAQLNGPLGVAVDGNGNIWIADTFNHRVRLVRAISGTIGTLAGTGTASYNGDNISSINAELNYPSGVAADAAAHVYIADTNNNRIRVANLGTGGITTVAGTGTGAYNGDNIAATSAELWNPNGVAFDALGNIYIADNRNNRIRRVDASTGTITTVAGNGSGFESPNNDNIGATSAAVSSPASVAVDLAGDLYIADFGYSRIRRVQYSVSFGSVSLGQPSQSLPVAFDFAATVQVGNVAVLTRGTSGKDFVMASGSTCGVGSYGGPSSCSVNVNFVPTAPGTRTGAVVVYDTATPPNVLATAYLSGTGAAPAIGFGPGIITTVAGSGTVCTSSTDGVGDGCSATSAELNNPVSEAMDDARNIYIADTGNNVIRKVDASTGIINIIAGGGTLCASPINPVGDGCPATQAQLSSPSGVAVDGAGNLYISDTGNHRIRKVDASTGMITTLAGTGIPGYYQDNVLATLAELSTPFGLALDRAGNLYVADENNNRVRLIYSRTDIITTVAGTGAGAYNGDNILATSAELYSPYGVALDGAGNLYIADSSNNRIRMVNANTGMITTLVGNGISAYNGTNIEATTAEISLPNSVVLDAAGNLYVSDTGNERIRKVTPAGLITTVVGDGVDAFSGDFGPATRAEVALPNGLAVDSAGNFYFADRVNQRIRKVDLLDPPTLTFPITNPGSISPAQDVIIENLGNVQLIITGISISSNFTLGGADTSCSTNGQLLAPAGSCILGIEFAPQTAATFGTILLSDNTLNAAAATQQVQLSVAAPTALPTAITVSASPPWLVYGQQAVTVTLTATVTGTQSAASAPSGTVDFYNGGTHLGQGSLVAANGTTAQASLNVNGTQFGVGNNNLQVIYSGDSNYLGNSGTGGLTVNPAMTTTLATSAAITYMGRSQTAPLSAKVTSPAGTVNDGIVTFSITRPPCSFNCSPITTVSATAAVSNGQAVATLTVPDSWTPSLVPPYTIVAIYSGSTDFLGSSDDTAGLTIGVNTSYLAVVSLGFQPPLQPANEDYLAPVASVVNYGPDTAFTTMVQFGWTDASGALHNLGSKFLGDMLPCTTPNTPALCPPVLAYVQFSGHSLPANSKIWASVTSASYTPIGNYASLTLNAVYYTLNSQGQEFGVNRDGYFFKNHSSTSDLWDLYVFLFGAGNVEYFSLFGITIPKPWPYAYYKTIFQNGFSGDCYGMSASSLQFFRGKGSFQTLVPLASTVYGYQDYQPNDNYNYYNPSNPVWDNIEIYHGFQFGDPTATRTVVSSRDSVKALQDLEAAMQGPDHAAGTPQILGLVGGLTTSGHSVVPYKIIETTTPNGTHTADIYVYDNNIPGATSQTVHVDVGSDVVSFSGGYNYSGLQSMPSDLNDSTPTLPLQGLANFVGLGVATVSGPANMLNTDSQGRSVGYQNGALVEQIPGGGLIRPLDDSSTTSSFPEAYRLPGGQYVTTISGNGVGSATATLFTPATFATFTSASIAPSTQDTINLSQDGSTVTLGTNAVSEQYSTTLSNDLGISTHESTVSNTSIASGETISIGLVNGATSFQIANQGSPKSYDLTLDQVGTAGVGQTSFTGLSIGAGETHTLTPSDWTNLGTAPVNLQIQNSQGTTTATGTVQSPTITSVSSASFTYGAGGKFVVTATGFPTPALSATGALPTGASFNPLNGVLSVPPSAPVGNYNITFMAKNAGGTAPVQTFTLTLTPAPLTVTVNNATRQYGQGNPTFAGIITGLQNNDNITATYSTTATPASNAGSYAITPTLLDPGGKLGNYAVTLNNGTLTVSTTPLTVTAPALTKILDAPNPAINNVTYSGFQLGDGPGRLSGTLSCTTTANTTSPVGSYPITCSGLTSANYSFNYVPGALKILYAPAGGLCDGDLSHTILQPVNADGTSVWKQGRTIPLKFRVCDANGVSIGSAGVITNFALIQIISGTVANVDETIVATTADSGFRFDPTAQQWIFNLSTSNQSAGYTYVYSISLNDGTSITFQYGLK